ncbi:MAG TPA: tyrosine-protein phosphatase [Caulobacteraceae bacterium]|jgi:protein tyrosine/serine phosphatase
MNRRLALEGVENFRDFGGYATASGRRLKTGRLYRSASHGRATDPDLEAIAALDIAVVVDLRRTQERARDPSRRHHAFAAEVIDNDIGEEEDDSWIVHITSSDLSPASFRDYMLGYYAEVPAKPRMTDLYRRYFDVLARADGPVLIHCAAGKDRTGILAALTHHLTGVGRDDLIADYLLTNDEERIARRLPQMIEYVREISGRTPPEDAMRVGMGVDAAYLETAFAAMTKHHGGIDAYLTTALGVDADKRRRIVARLVE